MGSTSTVGSESTSSLLQPGENIKPDITQEEIPTLVKKYYGIDIVKLIELNGYDDKNFYIEEIKNDKTNKYVFKVLNSKDSMNLGHVQAQNAVMKYLYSKGINCPVPLSNIIDGKDFEVLNVTQNNLEKLHVIRLLTFVEGRVMHDVKPSLSLLFNAGQYISKLQELLQKFNHPALVNHDSIWMIEKVPELHKFTYVFQNQPEKLQIILSVLKSFDEIIVPLFSSHSKLRKGVIHGDLNEQNILVAPSPSLKDNSNIVDQEEDEEYKISGLLDFGDMHVTFSVCELAVAMCYMMLECVKSKEIDPIKGSVEFLRGYRKEHRDIPEEELELLRTLISSRLCQSLVLGAYSYTLDPGNEYLLTTAKTGWNLLEKLWNETDEETIREMWRIK